MTSVSALSWKPSVLHRPFIDIKLSGNPSEIFGHVSNVECSRNRHRSSRNGDPCCSRGNMLKAAGFGFLVSSLFFSIAHRWMFVRSRITIAVHSTMKPSDVEKLCSVAVVSIPVRRPGEMSSVAHSTSDEWLISFSDCCEFMFGRLFRAAQTEDIAHRIRTSKSISDTCPASVPQ